MPFYYNNHKVRQKDFFDFSISQISLLHFAITKSRRQPQTCRETHVSSYTHTHKHTHTHTNTNTHTQTISNTNFIHTHTHTSHANLNVNICLTIFFRFFDLSNIFISCLMIVVIRRHETLGCR